MKCKEGKGNTFNGDTSCAACHAKLVSCNTGVETCIRFGCIPNPKVTVVQDGDPGVRKKKTVNVTFQLFGIGLTKQQRQVTNTAENMSY